MLEVDGFNYTYEVLRCSRNNIGVDEGEGVSILRRSEWQRLAALGLIKPTPSGAEITETGERLYALLAADETKKRLLR